MCKIPEPTIQPQEIEIYIKNIVLKFERNIYRVQIIAQHQYSVGQANGIPWIHKIFNNF